MKPVWVGLVLLLLSACPAGAKTVQLEYQGQPLPVYIDFPSPPQVERETDHRPGGSSLYTFKLRTESEEQALVAVVRTDVPLSSLSEKILDQAMTGLLESHTAQLDGIFRSTGTTLENSDSDYQGFPSRMVVRSNPVGRGESVVGFARVVTIDGFIVLAAITGTDKDCFLPRARYFMGSLTFLDPVTGKGPRPLEIAVENQTAPKADPKSEPEERPEPAGKLPKEAQEALARARQAYEEADFKKVLKECLPLAESGIAEAQYLLGELLHEGFGVQQDHYQAAEWFRQAAEQGYGPAQALLGYLYLLGQGVPQDHILAHMWTSLAEAAGEEFGAEIRQETAQHMTPEQIAAAQRLARDWKPKKRN